LDSTVSQADRDTAWIIARFFLGNGSSVPDELRSGKIERHFLLDVIRNQRVYGQGSLPEIRKEADNADPS